MIVIDTNILISALIKDSITRKIIIESGFQFAYPELSLKEIAKYERYIMKKAGYGKEQLDKILNVLLSYVTLIPIDIIKGRIAEAKKIMENIDVNDTLFIATALTLDGSAIWSNDADFDKQNAVRCLKTKDILRLLEK